MIVRCYWHCNLPIEKPCATNCHSTLYLFDPTPEHIIPKVDIYGIEPSTSYHLLECHKIASFIHIYRRRIIMLSSPRSRQNKGWQQINKYGCKKIHLKTNVWNRRQAQIDISLKFSICDQFNVSTSTSHLEYKVCIIYNAWKQRS